MQVERYLSKDLKILNNKKALERSQALKIIYWQEITQNLLDIL